MLHDLPREEDSMERNAYIVGNDIDREALGQFAKLLAEAYDNGEQRGGHMDWNDIQLALDKAVHALGGDAERYMGDAADGFPELADGDEPVIRFPEGFDAGNVELSAAKLLIAYRTPDEVRWEDVDDAMESLSLAGTVVPGM